MSDVLTKLINEGKTEGKKEGYIKAAMSFGTTDDNIISSIVKEFTLTRDALDIR